VVQKVLRSGRVAEQWLGGTKEVARRVSNTSCHDIIDRNGECAILACALLLRDIAIRLLRSIVYWNLYIETRLREYSLMYYCNVIEI
jgi:hypothetical protein